MFDLLAPEAKWTIVGIGYINLIYLAALSLAVGAVTRGIGLFQA